MQSRQLSIFSASPAGSEPPSDRPSSPPPQSPIIPRSPNYISEDITESGTHCPPAVSFSDQDEDEDGETREQWGDYQDTATTVAPLRQVINALEWEHHRDLATHLLSAHAVKKRYPHGHGAKITGPKRKINTTDKMRQGFDDNADDIPEDKRVFITSQWTAWPLSPKCVPREHDYATPYRGKQLNVGYNEKVEGKLEKPSQMLEEVLTAILLRMAKKRIMTEGNVALKPSVDDEESARLVRPGVRDAISKLDELLGGLHCERSCYVNKLVKQWERVDSSHELDELMEIKRDIRRKIDVKRFRSRSKARGTDKKAIEGNEDLTAPVAKKRERAGIGAEGRQAVYALDRKLRIKPRDWSQVLGITAVKGWDQGVLERTAGKCARMFDQDMEFVNSGLGGWRDIPCARWKASKGMDKGVDVGKDSGSPKAVMREEVAMEKTKNLMMDVEMMGQS